MVVYDNNTYWNSACNIINHALQLYYQINSFYAMNQCFTKRNFDKNNDNRSI